MYNAELQQSYRTITRPEYYTMLRFKSIFMSWIGMTWYRKYKGNNKCFFIKFLELMHLAHVTRFSRLT